MTNLLMNPGFEGATYKPKNPNGSIADSLVLPDKWQVGWLDCRTLYLADRDGVKVIGQYSKGGPRPHPNMAELLKPEVLVIEKVQPYLDPIRILDGNKSVTGFKLYGTICAWLCQTIPAVPGTIYCGTYAAHAWARANEDPNDAHYSHGIGTGGYYAVEGAPGLNDDQANYRFRCGVDPFGGVNPFGSAVVWGKGAHIYNEFRDVPGVLALARADSITFFIAWDNLWGFNNSNAYFDSAVLEVVLDPSTPPIAGRGAPRTQYARTYNVIPQTATEERAGQIFAAGWRAGKQTAGGSHDDAGLGDLNERTAKLWDIPDAEQPTYRAWYAEYYPGVTVEFCGGVVIPEPPPTIPTTPPPTIPRLARPRSMGGVHVSHGGRTGYGDFLGNCGKSIFVKSFMDFGSLMEAKVYYPGTVTVVRVRPQPTDEDTPPENWQWPLADSRRIARAWMAECYPELARNDRRYFDFVEVLNEPDPADAPAMERACAFTQYCMEDAEAHGYKLAIWAWAAGLPRTPTLKAGEFAQMEASLETLKYAAEHGHALATHEGSVDPSQPLFQNAAFDRTALRYRVTKRMLDARGWPMPQVVITEAYQESGYRRPNWPDWKWYLSELALDDYVLGAAWFTLGDWSFGDDNVNIVGQLPKFAQLIASMPDVPSAN